MTREQQIEELTKLIQTKEISHCDDDMHCEDCYCGCKGMAEMIYNAGYRKVPDGAVILSPEERDEEMKAYNEDRKERENELLAIQMACFSAQVEVERLKAENERFVSNMENVLEIEKENAVKEFAEHLKKYAIKTNSPAWGLIEFVEVSDIDKLLLTDY